MKMILEVEAVNQSFRAGFWMNRVQVLHEVSLNVPERSIFGFLGANGAGKTTLIHLIAGLHKPSSGSVRIGGLEAITTQAREKIGYLPERPYFYEHLTGAQFLTYFGRLSGMSASRLRERIEQVLSTIGMTAARNVELRKYSKGMLQRIGIAQAILHEPQFLVLDEPMSGLDPLGRKEMRELILQLAQQGHTVFFSSHVIPDVEAICDQVALIEKGKIKGSGPIRKFLSEKDTQYEVVFSGLAAEQARASGLFETLREIPEGIRGQVSALEVDRVLGFLLEKKAKLLWVNPIRPSLESFFDPGFDGKPRNDS
jgi:ABC-2 type transport system ATP-binding protein